MEYPEPAPELPKPGTLTVGYYMPSPKFARITEHVAVMRATDDPFAWFDELVAVTGPAGNPRSIAEAHLFAAAPDLLAACEMALGAWKEEFDRLTPGYADLTSYGQKLRAAIGKALGLEANCV